jgi:hypothetical protein
MRYARRHGSRWKHEDGGILRMRKFLRKSPRGATQLGFLDVVTAIIVLAVLIFAASRQFPIYRNGPSPNNGAQTQSSAH